MKNRVHSHTRLKGRAVCLLWLFAPPLAADPLYVRNLAPVAGLIGFPVLRDARALDPGELVLELHSGAANTQTSDASAREAVVLDGETLRLAPRLRFGVGGGWEVEAEVPWVRHRGGQLDQLIENWHDLWGFPNGDRDRQPRDRLLYGYNGAATNFFFDNSSGGLGDASLAVTKAVWDNASTTLSLRGQVKFASGDEDDWLGSGSADYSLGLGFTSVAAPQSEWRWHGQLGYTRAGEISALEGIQQRNLWFAGLGVEWRAWNPVHLKFQLDAHAAPTDSKLEQLGDPAVQLSAGLTWAPSPRWELDFSFSEDIAVNTAADIVFQFGVRYR